ncbi:MAG: hypothetical protein DSZ33_02135 [Gammaproteobacteria bacterium]|nr:MAG: hypothetical protein DSZ33_02135 [Gammaproteobacteria bacterium]
MPEILGLRKTGLEHLTERTQQDPAERHNTVQESILLMEEKMTDSFTVVTERVGTIFCSAGSSLTIADTVKDLKACRIFKAGKDAPTRLAASQKKYGRISASEEQPQQQTNMAMEISQPGYTLSGKNRPEKRTHVVYYKDVEWRLNG